MVGVLRVDLRVKLVDDQPENEIKHRLYIGLNVPMICLKEIVNCCLLLISTFFNERIHCLCDFPPNVRYAANIANSSL